VVRQELLHEPPVPPARPASSEREQRHALRGRLNTAVVALSLVEKQLQCGMNEAANRTLQHALHALEALDQAIDGQPPTPAQRTLEALLVDDDANEQALLSSYLSMCGYQVRTAGDGHEALEFLASHQRPDFLLLDMRMPRVDGPATVAAIRQNPAFQGLTIFAVSGSSASEFNLPAGKRGVDAWFQKPVNPARIVEAMRALTHPN
jgi:CheY-like chemotaxis protein